MSNVRNEINRALITKGYPEMHTYKSWNEYLEKLGGTISEDFFNTVLPFLEYANMPSYYTIILEYYQGPFDKKILITLFNQSNNQQKWAICDLIDRKKFIHGIEDWIVSTYANPDYGTEVSLLALAISKFKNKGNAIEILMKYFDNHPATSAEALSRIRSFTDIGFLRTQLAKYKNSVVDHNKHFHLSSILGQIERAIKKVEKRINI